MGSNPVKHSGFGFAVAQVEDVLFCFEPHYEDEAKCKVFIMNTGFHSYANTTDFEMKSFVLSLAFIMRFTATRKWPIQWRLKARVALSLNTTNTSFDTLANLKWLQKC